jgi:hypothetical protein
MQDFARRSRSNLATLEETGLERFPLPNRLLRRMVPVHLFFLNAPRKVMLTLCFCYIILK